MAKHTQTICRQLADELFECVWPFVKLVLKGLTMKKPIERTSKNILKNIQNKKAIEYIPFLVETKLKGWLSGLMQLPTIEGPLKMI